MGEEYTAFGMERDQLRWKGMFGKMGLVLWLYTFQGQSTSIFEFKLGSAMNLYSVAKTTVENFHKDSSQTGQFQLIHCSQYLRIGKAPWSGLVMV